MSIKRFSFSQIKEKASRMRPLLEKFPLSELDNAFLASNEYAPLIGTICDEQINSDDAWDYPEWLHSKVGTLDPESLLKLELKQLLREYLEDKWPARMNDKDKDDYLEKTSKAIKDAMDLFLKASKSPISMFEDRTYSALEVFFMLRRIPGFGHKKANMITRDFIYRSLGLSKSHSWFDQVKRNSPHFNVVDEKFLDMPIDVHVVKVFNRIFGRKFAPRGWQAELPNHIADILAFSKLAFPDFPAKLDQIFWNVGREYCYEGNPKCLECPLNELCEIGTLVSK